MSQASREEHLKNILIISMNIYEIIDEYKPDNSIFSNESPTIHKLKWIIFSKLTEADRRIILLYCEYGNMRSVAELLHISLSTAYGQLNRIKKNIKILYDES